MANTTIFNIQSTVNYHDAYLDSSNKFTTNSGSSVVMHGRVGGRGSTYKQAWWYLDTVFAGQTSGATITSGAVVSDAYFEVVLSSNRSAGTYTTPIIVGNALQGCDDAGGYTLGNVTWCGTNDNCINFLGSCNQAGIGCAKCVVWNGGALEADGATDAWTYPASGVAGATLWIPVTNCVQYAIDGASPSGELTVYAKDTQTSTAILWQWHSNEALAESNTPRLVVVWEAPGTTVGMTSGDTQFAFNTNVPNLNATGFIGTTAGLVLDTNVPNLNATGFIGTTAGLVLDTNTPVLGAAASIDATAEMLLSGSAAQSAIGSISGGSSLPSIALSGSAAQSAIGSISGGVSLPSITLSGSATISAIVNIDATAGLVLDTNIPTINATGFISTTAGLVLDTNIPTINATASIDATAGMLLSGSAAQSAIGSISGGSSLPSIALSGSAAQSAIANISSTSPISFSTFATPSLIASMGGSSPITLSTFATLPTITSISATSTFIVDTSTSLSAIASINANSDIELLVDGTAFSALMAGASGLFSLNINATLSEYERLKRMIINSRYPRNTNFLHPTGFKFVINRTPVVEYLCQAANLPSLSLGEIVQHNYFNGIKIPGDDFQFDDLSITFLVDESMKNWFEIYNWMRQISNVEDFTEYETEKASRLEDATLHIFTSGKNENIRMTFKDCFPKSLTGIDFDSSVSDIEPPLSTVVFGYTTYSIDFIKDPA